MMKNKMNKTGVFLGLIAGLLITGTVNAQWPDHKFPTPVGTADPRSICVIPKIDGDKVPFPLKNANTKFELAENETYLLNGTIVQQEGKTFFKVDFNSQPWLATQKRTQFPFFLIENKDTLMMKRFSGNLVQMAVVVRKQDVSSSGQEWDSSMILDVIASPTVIRH